MVLSRLVCSSESDELGIATQRSGIIHSTALKLRLLKLRSIQRTLSVEYPFCRQGCLMEYRAVRTLQKSWQNILLTLDSALRVPPTLVFPFLSRIESQVC